MKPHRTLPPPSLVEREQNLQFLENLVLVLGLQSPEGLVGNHSPRL